MLVFVENNFLVAGNIWIELLKLLMALGHFFFLHRCTFFFLHKMCCVALWNPPAVCFHLLLEFVLVELAVLAVR